MDFCFGFNGKLAYPTRLEVYDPQTVVTPHELNLSSFSGDIGYRISYNFTKQEGSILHGGCVFVDCDTNFLSKFNQSASNKSNNQSSSPNWSRVLTQYFDVGYLDSKMFYWNTTQTVQWKDLLADKGFDQKAFSFQGMDTWYQRNAIIEKNKEYYLRMWLTLVPSLEGKTHEFFVGFKQHWQSLEQAVAGGSFCCLDPWYDAAWNYRKSHTINATSGAGTGYQVKIWVHSGSGNDHEADVYCGGKCGGTFDDIRFTGSDGNSLLNYWIESISDSVATIWVNVTDDLSTTSRIIYVYYGNSGAPPTSNGTATFAFFDDFSSSPNGWTLTNGASISGGALNIYGGGGVTTDASKARPSGYTDYRFRISASCAATNFGYWFSGRSAYVRAFDYCYNPLAGSDGGPVLISPSNYYNHVTFSPAPTRDSSYHVMEILKSGSSYVANWAPSSTASLTDESAETDNTVRFGHWGPCTAPAVIDWVFLSKYVNPEPANAAWGAEESSGGSPPPQSSWTPYDWDFRKSHVIICSDGAGEDYQVKVHVWNCSGTDNVENVYVTSYRADFGDIRFTGSDGYTLLYYWMESCNQSNNAVFWVKVDENLTSVNRVIYVYYGNANATSESSGSNTFLFFTDWESGNFEGWTVLNGGGVGSGSIERLDSRYQVRLNAPDVDNRVLVNKAFSSSNSGIMLEARHRSGATVGDGVCVGFGDGTMGGRAFDLPNNGYVFAFARDYNSLHSVLRTVSGSLTRLVTCSGYEIANNYYLLGLSWEGSSIRGYVDKTQVLGSYDSSFTGRSHVFLSSSIGADYFDWCFVRKFTYAEPQHGDWGAAMSIGGWYNSSWLFRKGHIINASPGCGPNYQVRINAHYLNGTDNASDVYFGGKCKGGFGDVRFTAMDGVTPLSYWMETPCSDNATFWVKIPDNLTPEGTIVFVYYGNSAANSTSNGTATFDFFDDFSTDTGWTLSGATVSGGTLNLGPENGTTTHYAEKNRPLGYAEFRFRFRGATTAQTQYWQAYPRKTGDYPDAAPMYIIGPYSDSSLSSTRFVTPGGTNLPYLAPVRDENGHVLQVLSSGIAYGYNYTDTWDDFLFSSASDSTVQTGDKIAFCTCGSINAAVQIDWVFLAKYRSPEPAHGSWGIEEGSGPAAPSSAAVFFWGTRDYAEVMGGPNELSLSKSVSDYVQQLFAATGRYGYCSDYWGADTQPDFLYGTVRYSEANYNYSAVFYKGHSYPVDCIYYPNCPFYSQPGFRHFGIYDNEGLSVDTAYQQFIQDYKVHDQLSSGTHNFVCLWTCGSAWENATGGFSGAHSYGWEASWMNTTSLSTDAYHVGTSDSSGRCFIGFANFSICFTNTTGYDSFNYGHFVYYFFNYALQGNTIRDSLNLAVRATHNPSIQYFDQCQLYTGYSMWDPRQTPWTDVTCYMRIWGDGGSILPH
jgi:hypothetical protein